MMKEEYHRSFDRGEWTFDYNGNMIVPYEEQDYLFNVLKLKQIKIKKEILTEKMRFYLNMREYDET